MTVAITRQLSPARGSVSSDCICGGGLPEKLGALVGEAYTLRDSVVVGSGSQSLGELHSDLLNARGALDRLERIVADLTKLRGRAQEAAASTGGVLEDRIDHFILHPGNTKVGDDFRTGREREAEWRIRTVEEQVAQRKSKRLLRDVETALDICKGLHRGADSARQDINTLIRAVSVETRLES